MKEHLGRLLHSCQILELDCPHLLLERDTEALIAQAGPLDCLMRIVLTRGGHRVITLEELEPYPDQARLMPVTYSPNVVLNGVKSLSYAANMAANRRARAAGFDEALLVTPDGNVLEAPTSTIFWVSKDGVVKTPALELGILASITRSIVINEIETEQGVYPLDDLLAAREAFLVSTTRETQPVGQVGEASINAPGEVTRAAMAAVKQAVQEELGH